MRGGVFSAKLDTRNDFRLPDHCHDFQAEITAIKESLLVLPKRMLTTKNIFINLRSQVAFKSLKSFRVSSKTVKGCIDLLMDLTSSFTIDQLLFFCYLIPPL